MIGRLSACVMALALFSPESKASEVGEVFFCDVVSASAIFDGDTWRCRDGVRVRLFGANALERSETGGRTARDYLRKLIGGQLLACTVRGVSFDRPVASCKLPTGEDVAAEMVAAGMAWDCPKFSRGAYLEFEPEDGPPPSPGTRKMCNRKD